MKINSIINSKIKKIDEKTDYIIGSDLVENLHKISSIKNISFDKFLLLTDKIVFNLYGKKVKDSLNKMNKPVVMAIINEGEESKSISEVNKIISQFLRNKISRNSLLFALGGGVITDIGGFIASILLRGIQYINIPTTLLGMADASIGGKTGVNFTVDEQLIKNMVGTFKQPELVISDIDVLSTLPEKEIKNGLGEIIKYWIGWGKPNIAGVKLIHLPCGIASHLRILVEIISVCQKIKLDIIQKDPFETRGIRTKLNLGHTIGHAIEGAANGKLSHGEAVAIGLVAAAKISVLKKLLKEEKYHEIKGLIRSLGLPVNVNNINMKDILSVMRLDKKGGTFVLIRDIGRIEANLHVDNNIINTALEEVIL